MVWRDTTALQLLLSLTILKVKGTYLRGAFGGTGHSGDQIFQAPGTKLWHYATELRLRTFLVIYPLCGSADADTTDNSSDKCPTKPTDLHPYPERENAYFVPSISTISQRPHIPAVAFTSWHYPGSNLQPLDQKAGTLTTQPIQLA